MRYTGVMPWLVLLALSCSRPPIAEPEPPLEPTWRVASAEVTEGPFTNRLSESSSPYLRQHGHNPVDWYPWGDDALAEAARRDVPIFLSIGYAACHWCHVMEEESFEDPVLAAYLNAHFVPIKVDREERPDIDALYMDAVHALNGRGGWPASIWLTPGGEPFHAGTYFPPVGRGGRPGFRDVLESITEAWTERRTDVQGTADDLVAALTRRQAATPSDAPEQVLEPFVRQTVAAWDPGTRGWGSKQFPMSPRQQALLDAVVLVGDPDASRVVEQTLWTMDRGGLHDQLGGGFHRYTVDAHWQIPHFEKMLYDNGQLLGLYAAASVVFDEPRFAEVATATAEFMMRDLHIQPSGLFASSLDADTAGEEGTTYLWTPAQVREVLGEDTDDVLTAYAITPSGNFEGKTVLTRPAANPPPTGLRERLMVARQGRAQPRVDDKAVVSYNGLAATGLARAGRLLGQTEWVAAASTAMRVVLASRDDAGRLPRTVGGDAPVGVLEDYTATLEALVELHAATGDPAWMVEAESLWATMDAVFWDSERQVWRHSADTGLLVSRIDVTDGPEPSGVSQALRTTQVLTAVGSRQVPDERVQQAFSGTAQWLQRAPTGVPSLAVSYALSQSPTMTVVVAAASISDAAPFVSVYNRAWRPDATLLVTTSNDAVTGFALAEGKTPAPDAPRAFLCFDGACQQPVTEPEALAAQLESSARP